MCIQICSKILPLLTSHSLFSYCPISRLLIVNKSFESIVYTSWLHCPPPVHSSTHSSLVHVPTAPLRKPLMRPSKALLFATSNNQFAVLILLDILTIDIHNWRLLITLFGNCNTIRSCFFYHCLVVPFQFPLWTHWLVPNNSVRSSSDLSPWALFLGDLSRSYWFFPVTHRFIPPAQIFHILYETHISNYYLISPLGSPKGILYLTC